MVYIGVQGQEEQNAFTIIVWDQLFEPSEVSVSVLEMQTGDVYDVTQNLIQSASSNEYVYIVYFTNCIHSALPCLYV